MRLTDLKPGQVFTLEGKHYETIYVSPSGRIVMCYVLQRRPRKNDIDPNIYYDRVPDPDDLVGDTFLTTCFSDLRFEREHLTAEERAADEDAKSLL